MATMRAAVLRAFGEPLRIEEVPRPEPEPNRIVVRIEHSGVCHTDLHAISGDWPAKPPLPLIPGHEGAGRVAAVGRGVTGIKEGDRVGVPWLHQACGACEYCAQGWETLCAAQLNTGYSVNGTFAEYVLADPAFVAVIPAELASAAAAPVLCAGVTVYKGIRETEARPGEWLVVSGIGGLGHMAVQYARAMDLRVIAVDIAPDKLALAAGLGAEITVDATRENPVKAVLKAVGGAHGVLVTAVSRTAFDQAVGMLRKRGTAVLLGLPPERLELPIMDMVLRRKTVRGSIVGTREDLSAALACAAAGRVRAHYTTEKLERINDVFERMASGAIEGRVVLEITAEGTEN